MKPTKGKFKVEFLTHCKQCGNEITEKRFRSFCSKKCSIRSNTIKYAAYRSAWQLARYDRAATKPSDKKIKCLVCGRYYIQVCSHVWNRHKLTAREYKTAFGLDVKRGKVPEWYRKVKADITYENGTISNLDAGKKYWFIPGDKTAGKYERSEETIERLREQGRTTIHNTKTHKNK